ncbi:MAG: poly(3-hydroxybutyrate) depolymerase [Betaproteobacteria bacterium]|nr:poly(3-hydroxybutyrate) depolymerase [Betaproteobacteria bacterium]
MAVQFQVAYSHLVRGVGVVAGGPYDCARGSLSRALKNCMTTPADAPPPTVAEQQERVAGAARARAIDDPANLAAHRAWLFSGANDTKVVPAVVDALAAYYVTVLPAGAVQTVKHPEAGHAMISASDAHANACPTSEPPYINRCGGTDVPGALLAHLLGPLKPRAGNPAGELVTFDQRPFFAGKPIDASMGDEGYAYIPAGCRTGGCRVHVAFHGCKQGATSIGRRYVEGAGYNGWADANHLVILYPQATARYGLAPGSWKWVLNTNGCWDWWGYTDDNYANRDGVQMRGIKAMVDRLLQPPVH